MLVTFSFHHFSYEYFFFFFSDVTIKQGLIFHFNTSCVLFFIIFLKTHSRFHRNYDANRLNAVYIVHIFMYHIKSKHKFISNRTTKKI